ncbi:hypothetical protein Tco_0323566 [Tanacetum coccineum]
MSVPNNNWVSALAFTFIPLPENSLLSQTGPAYEVVKAFHPDMIHLQFHMEECHKLLINQVDEGLLRLALSITKMKAASYPNVGLEQMVPDQMWAEEEYMSPEPPTAQRQEDSLYCRQLMDKKFGYQKKGLEFMHDYKILDFSQAVVFRDKYGMQMIMRFNEIHKFSDGTLYSNDELRTIGSRVFQEKAKAQANLLELGKLCWWTHTRRRLQTSLENRMITSSLYLLTEMELVWEHIQQGTSNEVLVSTKGTEE